MGNVTTIGIDLAKNVFQVHAVDAAGSTVMRKRLQRGQVLAFFFWVATMVGMEACATAHYWARELRALGHEVRLMPPQYVKECTMLANVLRGHLAEFDLIAAQGLHKVAELVAIVRDVNVRVPDMARQVLRLIAEQIAEFDTRIAAIEAQIMAWHKSNPMIERLATIPGIGPIIATAIAATVADRGEFHGGRDFAAWLGLVPQQNSTGGKTSLGGISKRGDSYLRRLLVNGVHAVLLRSKAAKTDPWLIALRGRRPRLVVAVALANKTARIAWAIMSKQQSYLSAAAAA